MAALSADPIKHVVVLMLENQSFDRMLGALSAVYGSAIDGVDFDNLRTNAVSDTEVYTQAETRTPCVDPDPMHELNNVLRQIGKSSELTPAKPIGFWRRVWEWICALCVLVASYWRPKVEAMRMAPEYRGAFVLDYADEYPSSTREQRQEIMGYYPLGFLPAFDVLGRAFTVCDHWFSSVPGPTWANRFFVHSGTAMGRVWMPAGKEDVLGLRPYTQTTLYDRLNERDISWSVFYGDFPQSLVLMHQLERDNIKHYWPMDSFEDAAAGPADAFPQYCFIEPRYFGSTANDDHPPHNTMHAQCLAADVYNALRNNTELWKQTLLVIMYDEHGGFFDHVEPPEAPCPDDLTDEYTFARLGVRVPVLLVSPWVKRGVLSTQFDHTSLLKYLTDKWGLGPLGERVRMANSIAEAFDGMLNPREDTPVNIEDTPEMRAARQELNHPDAQLNGHQVALLAASPVLAERLDEDTKMRQVQALRVGPGSEVDEAKQVVELLVEQERRKAEEEERHP